MMRSLYSGVSGLRNHQTRMDVIGNNISNVNTAGFKTSRVVFQDVYSQTSAGASGGISNVVGGTNPVQIGLGVKLAAIDTMFTSAAIQRTDNPTDLMIEGEGFFCVNVGGKIEVEATEEGADPTYRMGEIQYTRAGNLYVDNAGNLVTANGNYILGMAPVVTKLTYTDGTGAPQVIEYDGDPANLETHLKAVEDALADTTNKDFVKKFGESTSDPAASDLTHMNVAGFTGISIDANGKITGISAKTDQEEVLGFLVLATFTNNPGLEKSGSSLYKSTQNSGEPVYTRPSTGAAGSINPGGLEMSNVDLAAEFTDMIITQRGFQANSRIITTSDSILEELVNLKR